MLRNRVKEIISWFRPNGPGEIIRLNTGRFIGNKKIVNSGITYLMLIQTLVAQDNDKAANLITLFAD